MCAHDPFSSTLVAARQGSEWAWAQLVDSVDRPLRSYIGRQGGTDVEDLVSETWLHVVRRLHAFTGDEPAFRSWVFTIAHHRIIDERRRMSRSRLKFSAEPEFDQAQPVESAESSSIAQVEEEQLLAVLSQLSPAQREVILLRFVAGFGINEIAAIIGKKPGAVSALQLRALKNLKKILGKSRKFSL